MQQDIAQEVQNYDFEEIETENHELTREISIRKSELDQ